MVVNYVKVATINSMQLTVSRGCRYPRPHRHGNIEEYEPEGHQGNKVIELVRPVHHKTQYYDQKIETEHHLKDRKSKLCQSIDHKLAAI